MAFGRLITETQYTTMNVNSYAFGQLVKVNKTISVNSLILAAAATTTTGEVKPFIFKKDGTVPLAVGASKVGLTNDTSGNILPLGKTVILTPGEYMIGFHAKPGVNISLWANPVGATYNTSSMGGVTLNYTGSIQYWGNSTDYTVNPTYPSQAYQTNYIFVLGFMAEEVVFPTINHLFPEMYTQGYSEPPIFKVVPVAGMGGTSITMNVKIGTRFVTLNPTRSSRVTDINLSAIWSLLPFGLNTMEISVQNSMGYKTTERVSFFKETSASRSVTIPTAEWNALDYKVRKTLEVTTQTNSGITAISNLSFQKDAPANPDILESAAVLNNVSNKFLPAIKTSIIEGLNSKGAEIPGSSSLQDVSDLINGANSGLDIAVPIYRKNFSGSHVRDFTTDIENNLTGGDVTSKARISPNGKFCAVSLDGGYSGTTIAIFKRQGYKWIKVGEETRANTSTANRTCAIEWLTNTEIAYSRGADIYTAKIDPASGKMTENQIIFKETLTDVGIIYNIAVSADGNRIAWATGASRNVLRYIHRMSHGWFAPGSMSLSGSCYGALSYSNDGQGLYVAYSNIINYISINALDSMYGSRGTPTYGSAFTATAMSFSSHKDGNFAVYGADGRVRIFERATQALQPTLVTEYTNPGDDGAYSGEAGIAWQPGGDYIINPRRYVADSSNAILKYNRVTKSIEEVPAFLPIGYGTDASWFPSGTGFVLAKKSGGVSTHLLEGKDEQLIGYRVSGEEVPIPIPKPGNRITEMQYELFGKEYKLSFPY